MTDRYNQLLVYDIPRHIHTIVLFNTKPNVLHKTSSNTPLDTALREVIGIFVLINLG
jgi:hypothetical protein